MNRKLSAEKLELFIHDYGRTPNKVLAEKLGISVKYVEFLCTYYGLKKEPDYLSGIRRIQGYKTAEKRWNKKSNTFNTL